MANNASFAEAASVAAASLRSSKLRSFLTLLGVILATATLIAVMSIINGMDQYVANQVSDMGAAGFRVRRIIIIENFDPKKFLEMEKRHPEMTREEYQFVRQHARLVKEIAIEAFNNATLKGKSKTLESVQIVGATSNYGAISNTQLSAGRFFTDSEDRRRAPVAIIGSEIKDEFFPNSDPLGQTISINGRPFEVLGVAKPKGSVFGHSRDSFALVPSESFFKMYGARRGIGYNAVAIDNGHIHEAMDEVRSLIRAWRQLKPGEEDTFGMAASESLMSAWGNLTRAIAATAVAVVSVFMVVGGVVIMNIMLAVVTERTHEIGIRKAIGARRRDILNQFLVESSMLSATGGFIGVLIAWSIAVAVRNFTPVPMEVPAAAVIVGVGLSTLVGLFFGIYPARRAARLDPIEALRYE